MPCENSLVENKTDQGSQFTSSAFIGVLVLTQRNLLNLRC